MMLLRGCIKRLKRQISNLTETFEQIFEEIQCNVPLFLVPRMRSKSRSIEFLIEFLIIKQTVFRLFGKVHGFKKLYILHILMIQCMLISLNLFDFKLLFFW